MRLVEEPGTHIANPKSAAIAYGFFQVGPGSSTADDQIIV